MKVKGVVAHSPSHGTLLAGDAGRVRLALNAVVHDMRTADGTCVNLDIPIPQSNCIPSLYLEFDLGGILQKERRDRDHLYMLEFKAGVGLDEGYRSIWDPHGFLCLVSCVIYVISHSD